MSTAVTSMPQSWSMRLLERGLLPDFLVRFGIRRLLKARLEEEHRGSLEARQKHLMTLFGIWLGNDPVDKNLKAGMLGTAK